MAVRGDFIPPVSDYAHWNEDAQAVWYEENKYDMMHWDEPVEYESADDFFYDDEEIPVDKCFELYKHQMNTSGRTIQFAGIDVYDQMYCDDCGLATSEYWPQGSKQR